MIASARKFPPNVAKVAWHARFLAMMPGIRQYARIAFRNLKFEAKEDAVVEAIANALHAYVALHKRGKEELAYATVLARYAVAQTLAGRRVGSHLNCQDVFTREAQRRNRFSLRRLSEFNDEEDVWFEATIEDTKTSVADQAAFRCDFPVWLSTHSPRNRQIAQALAVGDSPGDVAKRFGVSPGRISQLRRELHDSWMEFHGEKVQEDVARAA
jgi:hypothetical protein